MAKDRNPLRSAIKDKLTHISFLTDVIEVFMSMKFIYKIYVKHDILTCIINRCTNISGFHLIMEQIEKHP